MENCLRDIDPNIAIPYIDWTMDAVLGNDYAPQNILWSELFLGNGYGNVVTGPFANWPILEGTPYNPSLFLNRNLTLPPPIVEEVPYLMNEDQLREMVYSPSMRQTSWFLSNVAESYHGRVHNWFGGTMSDVMRSTYEPAFWMHHAFIDCIWEAQRDYQRSIGIDPQFDYPDDDIALGLGMETIDGTVLQSREQSFHYAYNIMQPFGLRNIDALSDIYTREFYTCAPRPTCSRINPNCGSDYLFCELTTEHCAPRLQVGANCQPFQLSQPCFNSVCCNGVCSQICNNPIPPVVPIAPVVPQQVPVKPGAPIKLTPVDKAPINQFLQGFGWGNQGTSKLQSVNRFVPNQQQGVYY